MGGGLMAPITIRELCLYRMGLLGRPIREDGVVTGDDYYATGLPMIGGCQVCGATVAGYNSCPSKTGYIRCASGCISDLGWDTVEEANEAIFGPVSVYASD